MVGMALPQHDGEMPSPRQSPSTRRACVAGGFIVALLTWGAQPAHAVRADPAPEPILVAGLPTGPAPESAYLAGLTIHDGPHRVHVPLQARRSHYVAFLGATSSGYALVDFGPQWATVYVLGGRRLRLVRRVENRDRWTGFLLGADGRHLLEVNRLEEPVVKVSVYDLHHRHVQKTSIQGFTGVAAFDGHTAYLVGYESWAWVPGRPKTQIWPSAVASVDVERHLLWVSTDAGGGVQFGPTSLDAPSAPAWAASFIPVAVSPDGQYVSGFRQGADGLQIRRLSDGSVVRELTAPFRYYQPLGLWESDGSVLATVSVGPSGRADIVVRCPVVGSCQVAAPKSRDRTFPFQLVVP
jgi:hypothetical protein